MFFRFQEVQLRPRKGSLSSFRGREPSSVDREPSDRSNSCIRLVGEHTVCHPLPQRIEVVRLLRLNSL